MYKSVCFPFSPIIAIEQNFKRCSTLKQILSNARASQVTVRCTDFLNVDPTDHQDVKYILVDPSCSGTGNLIKAFTVYLFLTLFT